MKIKSKLFLINIVIATMFFTGCSIISGGEVTIGNQVWMTENLNVDKFRNGDAIPQAKTAEEWEKAGKEKQPAWCYYNNDNTLSSWVAPEKGKKYGKLYNWYAVTDSRGLAPVGWHVPSDTEWKMVINFLGGEELAGPKMKSKEGWDKGYNGTNESGFSALPSGYCMRIGTFVYFNDGYYWSSTEYSEKNALGQGDAWYCFIHLGGRVWLSSDYKESGMSVRCLKD